MARAALLDTLDRLPTDKGKHLVLMRYGLGFTLFEAVIASNAMADQPLTRHEAGYILDRWHDDAESHAERPLMQAPNSR